ncbi:hypothetical protein BDB00DRAFT_746628, partial [Zychaea mexicana]|uniref:uncharacterized protein n=1 Tax=Zychaea mexicana TaxID=64656 RepID=UPI0022FE5A1F
MFGRIATLPTTGIWQPPTMKSHNAETWIAYLNHYLPVIHEQAKKNIQASQEKQQRYYNR